ncbi:hypothetical protein EBQ25_03335 [Allofranklinella schreckenbergeri]|uniref:Uncharacterized protein n=1 Tax=Allofranklinella schreckenbergeri TaxID=1076744 RepID=A0A3M6QGV9_9BURK|nr:hypothetical protein [Allofranklinella schreckenbergeri]RMX01699.1 hypothetical protein EBQ25_03335 [Allofranklinella schreckenbergeri]
MTQQTLHAPPLPAAAAARLFFRRASRLVLQKPADRLAHEDRVKQALALDGVEPLQGALVDMLVGCASDSALSKVFLQRKVQERLSPLVLGAMLAQVSSGEPLPRVNKLATRWCVLATPSLDVSPRALLCGTDDSRTIVANAIQALLEGDVEAEMHFLDHCVSSNDVLAFMLARKELGRRGRALSPQWEEVMEALQKRINQ